MRSFLSCLIVILAAMTAMAMDISGKWSGDLEIKLPDGNVVTQPAWAEFHQKGDEISGSAGGGDSDESSPLEKGLFDGKKLAFQFTGPDGRVYKASLVLTADDRFEGMMDFALPDGTSLSAKMTLKRSEKR
jgi:hypothetical protein